MLCAVVHKHLYYYYACTKTAIRALNVYVRLQSTSSPGSIIIHNNIINQWKTNEITELLFELITDRCTCSHYIIAKCVDVRTYNV